MTGSINLFSRSAIPRRAAVLNYFADGVRFAPDGKNDSGHPLWTPQKLGDEMPESLKPGQMKSVGIKVHMLMKDGRKQYQLL